MRLFVLLAALCALSQTAIAQTSDCKSIIDPGQRLACYDKASPPPTSPSAKRVAPVLTRAPVSTAESAKYVDTISAEDALMNARLRNICRGC